MSSNVGSDSENFRYDLDDLGLALSMARWKGQIRSSCGKSSSDSAV